MKVALLGLPGAGKTSLGRRLSSVLKIPCLDVDDDILEPTWGCAVAEKLADIGDEQFLKAEEDTLLKVLLRSQIFFSSLSSSGSSASRKWNPGLHR